MDRISELPESIVHHILSCLDTASPAEVVRMSVLSKTWFHLTASFPVLKFRMDSFTQDLHVSRQSFFKYVDYATSRFCLQNVTAHTLHLIATLHEPAELDIVQRCLESILNKGVKVLVIDIFKCRLPNALLSVSVLESLTIRQCDLPSSLMLDIVMFKSLIQLRLINVQIDDQVIKHLTASCPLLQELDIRYCRGFKRLCVYGQRLQKVLFYYKPPVETIDIEAPNLSDLHILGLLSSRKWAPRMNLASCKKLTTVTYYGRPLPNSNFLSNFPFVESLCLVVANTSYNLKLSSRSLRTLVLHSNDLEDIEFNTPNLVLFVYAPNFHLPCPMASLLRDSIHLKGCMQCNLSGSIDTLRLFQKLRRFLDKKNGFKVFNLYVHAIKNVKFTNLEMLKAIMLPPYELEHVEIQLDTHEEPSDHAAFVDAVLWCCRPRSLTLRSSFSLAVFDDVVKFTYEKLLEQEDEGRTNIQIVSPSSLKAHKHYTELKSLSMALPREGKTISFMKEEVVQEEAESQRHADM